jgi:hypothetical protein
MKLSYSIVGIFLSVIIIDIILNLLVLFKCDNIKNSNRFYNFVIMLIIWTISLGFNISFKVYAIRTDTRDSNYANN